MKLALLGVLGLLAAMPLELSGQVQGEVRGRVVDARSALGIGDVRVEVIGRADRTRTGSDGSFALRGLEPRDYTLRIRVLGYRTRDVDFSIANGRVSELTVALEPSPTTLATTIVRAARDTIAMSVAARFDRAAIEASGRRDVGELLQSAPGVVVTQSGGPGSASHVSIRGSSANEVLVLIDGVPLNSGMTGDADLSRIPLETVERVTVRTGAQSARYGARALAGVIEIDTRHPSSDVSALARAGAWGEHDASISLANGVSVDDKHVVASLVGDTRSVRGDFPFALPALRGGGTARRVNSDATSRNVGASLSVEDSTSSVRLRGSWESLERGLAGSIIQPSTTGREALRKASGGADARRDGSWWSLTATGDATRERETFVDNMPPFGTAYDDTVSATSFTGSVTGSARFADVMTSLGAEGRTLDVKSTMLAPGAPHWQRVLGAFGSVHISHFLNALDTRLDAVASGRVDNSSLDGATAFSPRFELAASRGVLTASASVASGYAPPSLSDQFFHEGVLVRANPALRPERTRGDVEARLSLHDLATGRLRFSATAAAYQADVDGMILWQPDFQFVWSPSNFAVHRAGWELSGRAELSNGLADIQGTLNTTDVAYRGAVLSGQVAYRPRTTASVTAGVSPRFGRFEITHQYVGARRTVPGSALNSLEPYTLTGVRWTSTLRRMGWQFMPTLGVDNVFDRAAAMLVDYPFPGRTWTVSLRVRRANFNP